MPKIYRIKMSENSNYSYFLNKAMYRHIIIIEIRKSLQYSRIVAWLE